MEQQQFKISLSVGTRLLLSVVSLLVVVIVFLNVSTILLLKEDKQVYTYQAKSTEAVLAGREFVNLTRHVLDSLRLSLATVDPKTAVTSQQKAALQAVIDNQSDAAMTSIYLVDPVSAEASLVSRAMRAKEFSEFGMPSEDFELSPEWLQPLLASLSRDAFALVNLSRVGSPPILGILLADLNSKTPSGQLLLAVGIISLERFGSELNGMSLTIATKTGWVLFDTDPAKVFSRSSVETDPLFMASRSSKVASGTYAYDLDGKRFLGSYVSPGLDLVVLTRADWRKAMQATYALTEKFILLGLMAIGAAIIFGIFFAKSLTAPINRLFEATKQIALGNFKVELKAQSDDEIGALTESFNVMSTKINELFEESVEKVLLESELDIASTVQQTLLPPSRYESPGIEIESYYQAASRCGGDWWGLFRVGNRICLGIADATGHGLPSALMTASARSCMSMLNKLALEDENFSFSPSKMLTYANCVIYESSLGKIMMTFFMAVIDLDTRTITYANAGHNPPWLFKKANGVFTLKSLTNVGMRLGERSDTEGFPEKTVSAEPGDMIFFYTDGLLEGRGKSGEMYGKRRMRDIVQKNLEGGPGEVVDKLAADFNRYNEGKFLDDDVTMAVVRLLDFTPGSSADSMDDPGVVKDLETKFHAET